jgi:hypothetical protein
MSGDRRYTVSDELFFNELWINCYRNQMDGYAVGSPQRVDFKPIVVTIPDGKGSYNRPRTLDGPAYTFTEEQKAILLATE